MLDEASAHLERSRAVWLSANRPSGAPHTTPVWFVVLTGAIWISIAAHRRKVALLRRDPHVSLAFDGTADVGGLVGEGTATVHAIDARPDVIAAFGARYGWDAASEVEGPRVLVRVDLSRWLQTPDPPAAG